MSKDTSEDGGDAPSFSSDATDGGGGRSMDDIVEAMADPRSRCVVSHFESTDVDVVGLDDLVDSVVEMEAEPAGESTDAADREDHRQRVAVALHHNRLPKLDDAAIVDYDPRSRTVRYWGDDRLSTVLELFEDEP